VVVLPTPSAAEVAFIGQHARYARHLIVVHRADVVELVGEVDSFYRKQLLLRDATRVWGWTAIRANILVRRPDRGGVLAGETDSEGRRERNTSHTRSEHPRGDKSFSTPAQF
jgi:hypothetical protein